MLLKNLLNVPAIPRRVETPARLVWLMLSARFLDEWLGGLIFVLMPVIRDGLGLSYVQVSVLLASFGWAAWIADPLTGLVGDVWPRRPLLAGSALFLALLMLVLSGAPGFGVMLLVCIGYSIGTTPLAMIADAVLVDTHPEAPGRIMARQTLIDTAGAFLAPLSASVLAVLGVPWPLAFVAAGILFAGYGLLLWRTSFPPQQNGHAESEDAPGGLRAMWRNARTVLGLREVWRWTFIEAANDLLTEVAFVFIPLFLADEIGLDEAATGLYVAAYMAASTVSLALLDGWLRRWGEMCVLWVGIIGAGALFPLLILSENPLTAFVLLVLLGIFTSPGYPVAKARVLAASEGYTATVGVLRPLTSLVTNVAPLVVGAVAGVAGLRAGMLLLAVAPVLMAALLRTVKMGDRE